MIQLQQWHLVSYNLLFYYKHIAFVTAPCEQPFNTDATMTLSLIQTISCCKHITFVLVSCQQIYWYLHGSHNPSERFLPSPTVTFLQVSVCPQWGGVHPLGRPPRQTASRQTPPPSRQPPGQTHPLGRHPLPRDGHCSRRYASYYNAFLSNFNILNQWNFTHDSVKLNKRKEL